MNECNSALPSKLWMYLNFEKRPSMRPGPCFFVFSFFSTLFLESLPLSLRLYDGACRSDWHCHEWQCWCEMFDRRATVDPRFSPPTYRPFQQQQTDQTGRGGGQSKPGRGQKLETAATERCECCVTSWMVTEESQSRVP